MPELPEVETVRQGLAEHVVGRTVTDAAVLHPRTARRQPGRAPELVQLLRGSLLGTPARRGKFLWLPLDGGDHALVAHLGMSGQFRVGSGLTTVEKDPHLRADLLLDGGSGPAHLWYVDQRTFGWLAVEATVPEPTVPEPTVPEVGERVPRSVAHIARDVLDPRFDDLAWSRAVRRRRTTVKRALLDQTLQSGIGNIYADEALWRAGLHPEARTSSLRRGATLELLAAVRAVLGEALLAGGTSFDRLYVNVNGSSGYFDRSLAVYGREGRPCPRCETPIRREPFANRSSHTCPRCQPLPRYRGAP